MRESRQLALSGTQPNLFFLLMSVFGVGPEFLVEDESFQATFSFLVPNLLAAGFVAFFHGLSWENYSQWNFFLSGYLPEC